MTISIKSFKFRKIVHGKNKVNPKVLLPIPTETDSRICFRSHVIILLNDKEPTAPHDGVCGDVNFSVLEANLAISSA